MTAGLASLFTSAPKIKLKINNTSVAYAIGFNVNIAIDVQPVQVIGQFPAMSLEPVLYNVVTGTIQIMKLVAPPTLGAQAILAAKQVTDLVGTPDAANAVGVDGTGTGTKANAASIGTLANSDSILSLQGMNLHMDPRRVLISRTFDMDLYLQVPTTADIDAADVATTKAPAPTAVTLNQQIWMRIRYCRLTSRNTNIAAGQLVNEPVNFQGLLATPADAISGLDVFGLDSLVAEKL